MDYANPQALVGADWLANHLKAPDLRILDATFFLPGSKRNAGREFERGHIPGAVFFDIERIRDETTDLPHMLPESETFSRKAGELGIGDGDRVVVYDANGGFSAAARAWWMFRVFGGQEVALLNGGLPKWKQMGLPLEQGPPRPRPGSFTARFQPGLVRDLRQMLANLESRRELVIDVRDTGRFAGIDAEPRPSRKRGHIPGSVNLPVSQLMEPANHFVMRQPDGIAEAFAAAGVDPEKPLVCSCGSGVTAAFAVFALYLMGHGEAAVYDGSWAEWGNRDDTPVES